MGENMSANNMRVPLQLARAKINLLKIVTFAKNGSKGSGFKWGWKRS